MSRKHYMTLAAALHNVKSVTYADPQVLDAWRHSCAAIADLCTKDPRFDRRKFEDACEEGLS